MSWVNPALSVGKNITLKYSIKLILAEVAKYILVGFPIISIILQVLAAANSDTK